MLPEVVAIDNYPYHLKIYVYLSDEHNIQNVNKRGNDKGSQLGGEPWSPTSART